MLIGLVLGKAYIITFYSWDCVLQIYAFSSGTQCPVALPVSCSTNFISPFIWIAHMATAGLASLTPKGFSLMCLRQGLVGSSAQPRVYYVEQMGLELAAILLPLPFKCCDYVAWHHL